MSFLSPQARSSPLPRSSAPVSSSRWVSRSAAVTGSRTWRQVCVCARCGQSAGTGGGTHLTVGPGTGSRSDPVPTGSDRRNRFWRRDERCGDKNQETGDKRSKTPETHLLSHDALRHCPSLLQDSRKNFSLLTPPSTSTSPAAKIHVFCRIIYKILLDSNYSNINVGYNQHQRFYYHSIFVYLLSKGSVLFYP